MESLRDIRWGDEWNTFILQVLPLPLQKRPCTLQDPEHLADLAKDPAQAMQACVADEAKGSIGACFRRHQVLFDGPLDCPSEIPEKHTLASWLRGLLDAGFTFTFAKAVGDKAHREAMVRCPFLDCDADRNLRLRDQVWRHVASHHTGKGPVSCSFCQVCFPANDFGHMAWRTHLKLYHNNYHKVVARPCPAPKEAQHRPRNTLNSVLEDTRKWPPHPTEVRSGLKKPAENPAQPGTVGLWLRGMFFRAALQQIVLDKDNLSLLQSKAIAHVRESGDPEDCVNTWGYTVNLGQRRSRPPTTSTPGSKKRSRRGKSASTQSPPSKAPKSCLLYTSDAADDFAVV